MFKLFRLIYLLREVDGLAFRKRIKIRFRFSGGPGYSKVRSKDGQSIEKEYYSVPIFYRSRRPYDPVRMAIHEVRHRVQHNHPEIKLFTLEDVLDEMRPHLQLETIKTNLFGSFLGLIQAFWQSIREMLKLPVQPKTVKKLTPREIDAQIFDELAYPVFLANNTDDFLRLLFHGTNLQGPK